MDRLRELFDYQKFAENKRLDAMFSATEKRYAPREELSDDDLATLAAAGEPFEAKEKNDNDDGLNG